MAENSRTGKGRTRSQEVNRMETDMEGSTSRNYGGGSNYEDEKQSGRRSANDEGKYSHLYNMIDAFIDNINMPRNRTRAIKFGVRALGEFFLNEEQGHSRSTGNNNGESKKQKKSKSDSSASKMRRG